MMFSVRLRIVKPPHSCSMLAAKNAKRVRVASTPLLISTPLTPLLSANASITVCGAFGQICRHFEAVT